MSSNTNIIYNNIQYIIFTTIVYLYNIIYIDNWKNYKNIKQTKIKENLEIAKTN
jgi:hypothetical protein